MTYTVTDIANEIYSIDLSEPTDISIPVITQWLRQNVGKLNNLIGSCYEINSTTFEITPSIGDDEKDIFKKLYELKYFSKKIMDNLGAAGTTSSVIEVTSDGGTVRKVNANEISKSWIQAKKDVMQELKDILNGYKHGQYQILAVSGDDIYGGITTLSENNRS